MENRPEIGHHRRTSRPFQALIRISASYVGLCWASDRCASPALLILPRRYPSAARSRYPLRVLQRDCLVRAGHHPVCRDDKRDNAFADS